MKKHLAVVGATVAACLAAASASVAAPIPISGSLGIQPHAIPVPASVVAAHPNGVPVSATAVAVLTTPGGGATVNAGERVNCWRAYFTNDNSPPVGTEKEWINPYWCGNGTAMRGVDTSWHGQTCTILVACQGEGSIGTWYGCPNYCGSVGQQIDGHFSVYVGVTLHTTISVVYELYPNGDYWAYGLNS